MQGISRLLGYISIALLVASIVQELRKPSDQRTWHGEVLGFVPYDLRPPTLERLRTALWNPADEHLFPPMVFGVGWTVNAAALAELLRGATGGE